MSNKEKYKEILFSLAIKENFTEELKYNDIPEWDPNRPHDINVWIRGRI